MSERCNANGLRCFSMVPSVLIFSHISGLFVGSLWNAFCSPLRHFNFNAVECWLGIGTQPKFPYKYLVSEWHGCCFCSMGRLDFVNVTCCSLVTISNRGQTSSLSITSRIAQNQNIAKNVRKPWFLKIFQILKLFPISWADISKYRYMYVVYWEKKKSQNLSIYLFILINSRPNVTCRVKWLFQFKSKWHIMFRQRRR